jgi:hypothetical protein
VYGERSFFYYLENGIDSAQLSSNSTPPDKDDTIDVYG